LTSITSALLFHSTPHATRGAHTASHGAFGPVFHPSSSRLSPILTWDSSTQWKVSTQSMHGLPALMANAVVKAPVPEGDGLSANGARYCNTRRRSKTTIHPSAQSALRNATPACSVHDQHGRPPFAYSTPQQGSASNFSRSGSRSQNTLIRSLPLGEMHSEHCRTVMSWDLRHHTAAQVARNAGTRHHHPWAQKRADDGFHGFQNHLEDSNH
jgi:hypothetical protein